MIVIKPITITPDSLTATGAILTASNVTEADESEYDSGTTYALGDMVMLTDAGYHRIYESLAGSNLNNYPPDNTDKWLDRGATNRWKMFDGSIDNQTVNSGSISIDLVPATLINSIALFNIVASTLQIVLTSAVDGEVYNETVDLTNNEAVTNWYYYFYEPIIRKLDYAINTLPVYGDYTIDVILDNGSDDAKCGQILLGLFTELGLTQFNARLGITDYSVKVTDAFGNTTLTQRKYIKRGEFDIFLNNNNVSYIMQFLTSIRATPVAWLGTVNDESTFVYGFFKDFNIELQTKDISFCSLEIEGL